jgi:hypothetical protein
MSLLYLDYFYSFASTPISLTIYEDQALVAKVKELDGKVDEVDLRNLEPFNVLKLTFWNRNNVTFGGKW